MMNTGSVKSTVENGIATISFFHPQSNSLPAAVLQSLAEEITLNGKKEDIAVIILKSEGDKAFCAGASFDELLSINNFEEGKKFFSGFANVINAMRKAPKFIVVRVQGRAVGGGVGLACAADIALASDKADVKLSELAVGIGPFVVGPAVERKAGNAAFSELTINAGEWRSAGWACEKGIYSNIYSSVDELDNAVATLAMSLSASNPLAMKMLKQVMWQGTDHWDQLLYERAEMSGQLVLSDFTRKAIARFKAERK